MNNIPYLLALHSINGLGPIKLKEILEYFKDPKKAWESVARQRNIKLDPEKYAKNIAESGIKWVTIFDDAYPKLLKEIYDPPTVLYYKGRLSTDEKAIAVVGTRKMTNQGRLKAVEFTKSLVNTGFTIVSGLARGVDTQAHSTAVAENGRTIAVLGSGINNIFPPENIDLAEKIAEGKGIIFSEFPPNYPALPKNFPIRNRIISGLSLAVLIVEAGKYSGSLITARLALEQGREVFAVPPNDLIRDGATAVFHPEEILHEMGF